MNVAIEILVCHVRKIDRAARIIDAHAFGKRNKTSPRMIRRREIATRKAALILHAEFDEQLRRQGK